MENNVTRLSDIKASPIHRCSTGFEELDYIYGRSSFSANTEWGLPQGKISLWSGAGGTGKSRLCIEVVKRFCALYPPSKVLYILTEAPLSDFGTWAKDTSPYDNVLCSSADNIETIINTIYQVQPHLVFVDSVNEIEDFNGTGKASKRMIKGCGDKVGFKQAINDVGGHLILLGQINADGKSKKGGSSLPHLVDIALDVVPSTESKHDFIVKVGNKNRFGPKDGWTIFTHTDDGVINNTDNRFGDKNWRQTHGIPEPVAPKPHRVIGEGGIYVNPDGTRSDVWTPAMQEELDRVRAERGLPKPKKNGPSLYRQFNDFLGETFFS
jgi:predicted ATP-dependent serine protease